MKVIKISKEFAEAIKAHIVETKERHKKLLSQIKPEVIEKLKKMNKG